MLDHLLCCVLVIDSNEEMTYCLVLQDFWQQLGDVAWFLELGLRSYYGMQCSLVA